ncbi:hypothetical protein Avbf_18187, partial [Armadillidium vulgare]
MEDCIAKELLNNSKLKMKGLVIFLSAIMVASGTSRMAFQLSAGAEEIVPNMDKTFTCDDKHYGYYADVNNNCQVFHVCLPVPKDVGEENNVEQFSFVCGNETVFNQETLTCTFTQDSIPCEDSEKYFSLNEEFGRILKGRSGLASGGLTTENSLFADSGANQALDSGANQALDSGANQVIDSGANQA